MLRGAVLSELAGAALGELADVVEEDRLLRHGEMRGVLRDLGEEGIGHEHGGLILMARGRVAEQGGDVDLEGAREAIKGKVNAAAELADRVEGRIGTPGDSPENPLHLHIEDVRNELIAALDRRADQRAPQA